MSLLLHDDHAASNAISVADISHSQLYEITGPKLAIETEVEEREFALAMGELKAYANSPDFLQPEGCLLTDNLSLVPGLTGQ
jgi:hypothetical protein